jgi:hypothetical protein
MDGWMVGLDWIGGWKDGWMDGLIDIWTKGWFGRGKERWGEWMFGMIRWKDGVDGLD